MEALRMEALYTTLYTEALRTIALYNGSACSFTCNISTYGGSAYGSTYNNFDLACFFFAKRAKDSMY